MDGMPSETVQYIKDALKEQGILTPNVLAYALATAKAESGGLPEREGYYLDKNGRVPGTTGKEEARKRGYSGGENFYGRGFIQLTHDYNYRDIGRKIGLGDKLVNNPDMALDPKIAAKVLAVFFKEKGIADLSEKGDFVGARRGVNPDARGEEIAGIAQNYLKEAPRLIGNNAVPQAPNIKVGQTAKYNKNLKQWQVYDGKTNKLLNPTPSPVQSLNPSEGGIKKFFKNLFSSAVPNAYADTGLNRFQPQRTAFQPNMYTVQPGDTLSGIAQKYLGNPHMYPQISGYASGNPNMIRPGEKLNLGTTSGGPGSPYPNMSNGTYNPRMYPVQQQATQQQAQNFQPSPQTTSQPSAQLSWKPQQQTAIEKYLAQNPTQNVKQNIPTPTQTTSRGQQTILPKNSLTLPGWGTGNAISNF